MNRDDEAGVRKRGGGQVFGRPGGPARFALGVLGLIILLTVTVTVARIDDRLGMLIELNHTSLAGAHQVAGADDRLTRRLHELGNLAGSAHSTLESTRALQPVLADLQRAVRPTTTAVGVGRAAGERSVGQLDAIRDTLQHLDIATGQLARSADVFDQQGLDLLPLLDGLIGDLRASVGAARRINATLPLPRTGGR